MQKSTPDEIRQRFDNEVERFSNLETGQVATIDAPLVLELLSAAAAACTPHATHILDVGCGAGNNTLKLLQKLPNRNVLLVDLSGEMLRRANQRAIAATTGNVISIQSDIRDLPLAPASLDIIVAAAVLHHLRTEDEWLATFKKFHAALRPGGSLWISDLITHTQPAIQSLMWQRYGEYLSALKGGGPEGDAHRDRVYAYIEMEDTPRPLMFQIDMLRKVGFAEVEVLHKNSVFAAFGARRA